jgi:hypothetical protein
VTEVAGAAAQGQTSGQSSSSSAGQSSQAQGSAAQGGASGQGQTQAQQNNGQQDQQGQQQAAAPTRPDWVPERFWDPTKNEIKGGDLRKDLDGLSAFKAEQDIRANTLPKSADDYQITLPEGFKPPEGVAFEFDKDDPLLRDARVAAHELKVDQAGFSRMLGIFAANKIGEYQRLETARTAQMEKLGTTGPQRIAAVTTWLRATGGPQAEILASTLEKYPVADNVAAFENLIKRMSSQGGTGFSQQHREGAPEANKIPGYENMTFEQRRAAQMNMQSQQRAAPGR